MTASASAASGGAVEPGPLQRLGGIVPQRTSDRVFNALASAIRALRLPPGHPIAETELARSLGVSRTPIREAISRLNEQGLVRVIPQVGTRVSLIQLDAVCEAQFVREHLEVAAYRDACTAGELDLSQLTQALSQQRAAQRAGDFEAFFAADESFHAAVFAAGGHSGAWDVVQQAKFHLDRVRRLASAPPSVRRLIQEHVAIYNSLRCRDPSGSELVVAHARRVLEYAPGLSARYPSYFEA